MTDQEVLEKLSKYKKNIQWWYLKKTDHELVEYLENRYPDSQGIEESYWRIKLHIDIRPVCKTCGKPVWYLGGGKYRTYCCKSCVLKDPELREVKVAKSKATSLARYGVTSPMKLDWVKQKGKQTNLEKHGCENYNNADKRHITNILMHGDPFYNDTKKHKQTCLERHGNENYTNREKYKATCLDKFGVDNNFKTEETKNKIKDTCLIKYDSEYFCSSETGKQAIKEAVQEKYGYDYAVEVPEVQEKIKETNLERYGVENIWEITKENNPEIIEKRQAKYEETCLERYGVTHTSKLQEVKDKIVEHGEATKAANHTFNTSQPEDDSYILIKEKFPNVKRQYKDKIRYPFRCDFYIPELDLFIECQYGWTHGFHPFDPNNIDDINRLNEMKEKYGDKWWHTWVERDVIKREKVKESGINYIEFWNIDELKNWLNNTIIFHLNATF